MCYINALIFLLLLNEIQVRSFANLEPRTGRDVTFNLINSDLMWNIVHVSSSPDYPVLTIPKCSIP